MQEADAGASNRSRVSLGVRCLRVSQVVVIVTTDV